MNGSRVILILFILVSLVWGSPHAEATPPVRFAIFNTGYSNLPAAFAVQGRSLFKNFRATYSAFLIQHGEEWILIDAGLGKKIRSQFKQDMPLYLKPLIKIRNLNPLTEQLPEEFAAKIKTIFLTHTHWDHLSGALDFPGACVSIAPEEVREIKNAWPSQTRNVTWCPFTWNNQEFLGFEKSYDVFGDQSVVIVPLPGHTEGSIGVFLETTHDRYFLVGDVSGSKSALLSGKQRARVLRWVMDHHPKRLRKTMSQVRRFHREYPETKILPSHDTVELKKLGFYPNWIE